MGPLRAEEARVLGSLLEKAMTTPDYYPLTVNGLLAACNQRTNRDPVVDYDHATVEPALGSLDRQGLIGVTRVSGGRVLKYLHHAGAALRVDDDQLAILAVLMLRGPRTPGELRSRTERYRSFESMANVEEVLRDLSVRDEPLVERLRREPGQKESRYRTLLTEAVDEVGEEPASPDLDGRVAQLEEKVELVLRHLGLDGPGSLTGCGLTQPGIVRPGDSKAQTAGDE